jgi:uncharacterized repeat protein (TIGR03803 family)
MKNTPQHRNWISRMHLPAASAALAFAAVLVPAESAQFKVLYSFDTADGRTGAGLIQGTNGDLYGTTLYGGAFSSGSVFKMALDGKLTTMYSFCSPPVAGNCVLGLYPGALVLGTNGDIYGVSEYGGLSGTGIIFKTIPSSGATAAIGDFQVLEPPDETNSTGAFPVGALVQATDGKFWGVAQYGGALGQGTKFEVGRYGVGSITTFGCIEANCHGGVEVAAGLVQGTDGNFYGTSVTGGTGAFPGEGGSVFQITPSGLLTTIYSFCSLSDCTDGQAPMGALVQGTDGNFYGTTYYGGTGTFCDNFGGQFGCGTVFQLTPSGTLATLHSFCTIPNCKDDGAYPIAGLILGSDGNFYGTTYYGGRGGSLCSDYVCGTIFQITPSGTLTPLHYFCYPNAGDGCPSGGGPVAPLVQDTNGKFYGTTTVGGSLSSSNGTVFVLSTGLPRFVKTLPTSGVVGAAVKILGTDLTGATSVTFNGTAAVFTVVRPSEITTTVPTGATSGEVQVTTPSGTLSSNVNFLVTP